MNRHHDEGKNKEKNVTGIERATNEKTRRNKKIIENRFGFCSLSS